MAKKTKPRGRPPLPKGEERDVVLTIRLRPADRKKLEKAAQKAKQPVSVWARTALLDLATS